MGALNYDKLDKYTYNDIKRYLRTIIKKEENFDYKYAVEVVKAKMRKLLELTDSEIEFIHAFKNKEYRPELLFDNNEILGRINTHPMAMWRTRKLTTE